MGDTRRAAVLARNGMVATAHPLATAAGLEVLQRGWSVLAVGHASEVAGEDDLATFRALGLAPWADGTRTHYVRLVPEVLTGRRIVAV